MISLLAVFGRAAKPFKEGGQASSKPKTQAGEPEPFHPTCLKAHRKEGLKGKQTTNLVNRRENLSPLNPTRRGRSEMVKSVGLSSKTSPAVEEGKAK